MVAQMALMNRVHLSSNLDGMVQTISADQRRIKQIVVNLLSNAVKFTPVGGKVGLDMRGDAEQQTVTLTVWDTGIGIAEKDLRTLFHPFVQLDSQLSRQYEGTGLGLALVLRLAEAHCGSVSVESTLGQGSRFSVTLPWDPAAEGSAPAPDMVTARNRLLGLCSMPLRVLVDYNDIRIMAREAAPSILVERALASLNERSRAAHLEIAPARILAQPGDHL
jgi:anti-sigma regulatory factor (Ser/Thr protein kinase)